jgi:anti-sigma-K factor RskA
MSDHPELENSVAAFVLGAAAEEEAAAVRAHLGGCAECRELASRLQRAAAALPLATDLVEPPARLKSRILAAAAASPRPHSQTPIRRRIVPLRPSRAPGWARAPRWRRGFPTAAVAALALAVLALGAWNLHLVDQLNHQQAPSQVASTTLVGSGPMTGVRATVLDFKGQSVALLTFSRMPVPAPGKVYEVWLIPASGAPVGVAVFQPDADGGKTIVVTRDIQQYKVIAVTVEQGPSGATAPTQSPSLAGNTV